MRHLKKNSLTICKKIQRKILGKLEEKFKEKFSYNFETNFLVLENFMKTQKKFVKVQGKF